MPLLSVPHQQQRREADCLAACAVMALEAVGRKINYARVARLLRVETHGTPFRNLRLLEQLGVTVQPATATLIFGALRLSKAFH